MDLTALKAEIGKPEYSGKTDAEIAAAINTRTISVARDTPIHELEGYCRVNLLVTGFEDFIAANPAGAEQAVRAAREFIGLIKSPHLSSVEMSKPATAAVVAQLLGALKAAGQITQTQYDEIMALGTGVTSRREQLGWPEISADDVATARAS